MANSNLKDVCIICGVEFKEGEGWVEKHHFPCANDTYGWNFTKQVPYITPEETADMIVKALENAWKSRS